MQVVRRWRLCLGGVLAWLRVDSGERWGAAPSQCHRLLHWCPLRLALPVPGDPCMASSLTTGLSSTSPSASNHSSSPGPGLPVPTSSSRHSTQPSLPSYPQCQHSLPSAKPAVSCPPFLLPFPLPKLPSPPVSTKFLLLSLCLFLFLVLYTT